MDKGGAVMSGNDKNYYLNKQDPRADKNYIGQVPGSPLTEVPAPAFRTILGEDGSAIVVPENPPGWERAVISGKFGWEGEEACPYCEDADPLPAGWTMEDHIRIVHTEHIGRKLLEQVNGKEGKNE
jgi:hypothetical protein